MKFFLPVLFPIILLLSSNSVAQNSNELISLGDFHQLSTIGKEQFTFSGKNNLLPILYFKNSQRFNSVVKSYRKDKTQSTASTLPIAIGIAGFLYLLNPIILFENDKIALGITKEVSVGYGNFGEHRASFEYSYIFRKDLNSHIRVGYKYDILMKAGLKPSNQLQGTSSLTLGGGYFNNFSRPGYFAESAFGYSFRNDKFLFYPNMKLRYTYVAQGSNIIDFSFGILIGIANPFLDLKIRNKHKTE